MKIALAQLNFRIGDFDYNTQKIKDHIEKARQSGAHLIVFSELSVAGYPPQDFLEFDDFIDKCWQSVLEIAAGCVDIAAIIGCPARNTGKKGKRLYNSAVVLYDGKVHAEVHKTLLPTYDVFDEYRYFEPNRVFNVVDLPFGKFALTICEDLWNVSDYPLYVQSPMEELIGQEPEAIINIAASPFHYNQVIDRTDVLGRNAQKYTLPVLYVNQVGAQTELIFDGGSMVINSNGAVVSRLEFFKEDFMVFDTEKPGLPQKNQGINPFDKIELIHDALVLGIRDYFGKLGLKKAILGLSGGIDSAVVLVLAARALGNENVMSLLLPSGFSSGHSVNDAVELAHNLQTPYELIQIENAFQTLLGDLKPYFKNKSFDVAEENIQARIRAILLMAFSNKFGYILLNTSNKSEAAVGYGTLYGDMCGGLSVLGDVYKTEVYELARFINRDKEIIPENVITKPPSAELRPDQKDSDSLPEYDLLDKILFAYIEQCLGPEEIIKMGFEPETVKKVLKLVNSTEWKRHQTPPVLRVSPKAFGFGRRMPIAARYLV
jgi:NAD+ synthase (glutamine-hydrolysing)